MKISNRHTFGLFLALVLSLFPITFCAAEDVSPNSFVEAYRNGQITKALNALNTQIENKNNIPFPQYISAVVTLLDLQFISEDVDGFDKTVTSFKSSDFSALSDVEKNYFQLLTEAFELKGLYLRKNHTEVIDRGLKALQKLGDMTPPPLSRIRSDISITVAASFRATNKTSLAENLVYQSIILSSFDHGLQGYESITLIMKVIEHYLELQDVRYLDLIFQILAKYPGFLGSFPDKSIENARLSSDIAGAAFILDKINIGINFTEHGNSSAKDAPDIAAFTPLSTKLGLLSLSLFINSMNGQSSIVSQIVNDMTDIISKSKDHKILSNRFNNLYAWAYYKTGQKDKAQYYLDRSNITDETYTVFTLPLYYVLNANLALESNLPQQSLDHALKAFLYTIKLYYMKSASTPNGTVGLSVAEKYILQDFLKITSHPSVKQYLNKEILSASSEAIELLQRQKIIVGARIAEGRMVSNESALLAEHIRQLDRMSEAKFNETALALEKIISRQFKQPEDTKNVNIWARINGSLEIQNRLFITTGYLLDKLGTEFLISRNPVVSLTDVQSRLGADEVIVSPTLTTQNSIIIECITKESSEVLEFPLDHDKFWKSIKLINLAVTRDGPPSKILDSQFPATDALYLYNTLFAPVSHHFKDKTKIIIAPDPDLASLPFNTLLTAMPEIKGDGYDLQNAPWLIKNHALSLIMSRSIFVKQRMKQASQSIQLPFIAFSNPSLSQPSDDKSFPKISNLYAQRGVANALSIRTLPSLPDTEEETIVLANTFGADNKFVYSKGDATEKTLRSLDLSRFKVITFATHGLMAGEFEDISEPALVLTPEDGKDSRTDGLLTMSEISKFSLNASLVILSACNTAAGDGTPTGKGFSGLASAFFSAGARNLLASQWPVVSFSANRLTTGIFKEATKSPKISIAEALQKSMLNLINDPNQTDFAHPRFWAPFVLAGDGTTTLESIMPSGSSNQQQRKPLDTVWEKNFAEIYSGEVYAINAEGQNEFYVLKMGDPDPDKNRSRSVFLKIDQHGNTLWGKEDFVVAAGTHIFNTSLGPIVDGYVYSDDLDTGAVLKAFSPAGNLRWTQKHDSPAWDQSLGMVKLSEDRFAWLILNDNHKQKISSGITLIELENNGSVVNKKFIELSLPDSQPWSSNIISTSSGLIVTVSYRYVVTGINKVYTQYTGYANVCTGKSMSVLLLIDPKTGKVLQRRDVDGVDIKHVKQRDDGKIFCTARISYCTDKEGDASICEILPNFDMKPVFMYGSSLNKNVGDFVFLKNNDFLMVGQFDMFFLPDLIFVKSGTDNITSQIDYTGELFDRDNKTIDAFVALISSDGKLIADKMYSDLRGRWLNPVAINNNGSILTGGTANGVSSWLISINDSY